VIGELIPPIRSSIFRGLSYHQLQTEFHMGTDKNKTFSGAAKYDYVKVKIWLENHYYIFSRFILSRMLTLSLVSVQDSNKISLDLKKILVEANILELSQDDFDKRLFDLMKEYGYQEETIHYYCMMRKFHHKRVPLLIILFGSGCVGKSHLATQLTERLNMPNVLQTDILFDLSHSDSPCWLKPWKDRNSFIEQFKIESKQMYGVLQADIEKTLSTGKSLMIEGSHINPSDFADLFSNETKGIIIPLFITMKNDDHDVFVESWVNSREWLLDSNSALGTNKEEIMVTLKQNFSWMNDYLEKNIRKKCPMVTIEFDSYQESLNNIHDLVLKRINDGWEKKMF
jgi:2-phosphoglycerate kinase